MEGQEPHEYTGEDGRNGEIYFYNKYSALGFKDLQYDEELLEGYIRLSPERQIYHIWNEWREQSFRSPLSPFLITKIFLLTERREATLPLLYNFLRNTREERMEGYGPGRHSNFASTVDTLEILIRYDYLNQDEKKELALIYQQKNDEYIRNYGQITNDVIRRYVWSNYLNGGMWSTGESTNEIADKLIAEYKALGYNVVKNLSGRP
jgi:hypothetical protein